METRSQRFHAFRTSAFIISRRPSGTLPASPAPLPGSSPRPSRQSHHSFHTFIQKIHQLLNLALPIHLQPIPGQHRRRLPHSLHAAYAKNSHHKPHSIRRTDFYPSGSRSHIHTSSLSAMPHPHREETLRHILALRIDHRLIRHMDLGSRTRSRKTAQLFRTDRMELGLSLHLFHKLKHTLIPIVRPIPLAVLTDETGTDKNMYHEFSLFHRPARAKPQIQLFHARSIICQCRPSVRKAGPPHKSTCGSDPAFSFLFSEITLRLRNPLFTCISIRSGSDYIWLFLLIIALFLRVGSRIFFTDS